MCDILCDVVQLMRRRVYVFLAVLVVVVCSVSCAITYYYKVPACSLCNAQRLLVAALGITSICGLLINKLMVHRLIDSVNIIISSLGIFCSCRQLWLQWHPLTEGAGFCDASFSYLLTVMTLPEALWHLLQGGSTCVSVKWQFWHVSLAAGALGVFVCCCFLSFLHLRAMRRK